MEIKRLESRAVLQNQQIPIQIKHSYPDRNLDQFPEREYTSRFSRDTESKNIGYVYRLEELFPLYLYRIDRKFYYHVIDKSRNNVKIPIENRNQELYEGDVISIPELGGDFTVKFYEYSGNIYRPY